MELDTYTHTQNKNKNETNCPKNLRRWVKVQVAALALLHRGHTPCVLGRSSPGHGQPLVCKTKWGSRLKSQKLTTAGLT